MKLEGRERKAVIAGAGLALGIVVVGYVILPMTRTWSDNQDRLTTRQNQIATLKDHAKSQESLVTRRNVLNLRLGSLFGVTETSGDSEAASELSPSPPGSESQESEQPPAQVSSPEGQSTPAKASQSPRQRQGNKSSGSLAGYVEQTAKKAGIKIKRITPRRTSGGKKSAKYFRPVTLQVKVEANPLSLIAMLAVLEGGEYLVRIDSLQIRRDIQKGDSIDATFEVVGYEALGKAS